MAQQLTPTRIHIDEENGLRLLYLLKNGCAQLRIYIFDELVNLYLPPATVAATVADHALSLLVRALIWNCAQWTTVSARRSTATWSKIECCPPPSIP